MDMDCSPLLVFEGPWSHSRTLREGSGAAAPFNQLMLKRGDSPLVLARIVDMRLRQSTDAQVCNAGFHAL